VELYYSFIHEDGLLFANPPANKGKVQVAEEIYQMVLNIGKPDI
jgi:hypothetical protein